MGRVERGRWGGGGGEGALVLILCMQLGVLGGEETHEYRDAGSVWRRKDRCGGPNRVTGKGT